MCYTQDIKGQKFLFVGVEFLTFKKPNKFKMLSVFIKKQALIGSSKVNGIQNKNPFCYFVGITKKVKKFSFFFYALMT